MGGKSVGYTFYDVLNIRSDSSEKEIKAAYVALSKKFHPDVKGLKTDSQQTASFLKISEAYQTLSKPMLRNEYDRNLQATQSARANKTSSELNRNWEIKPNYNPTPGPYYGIKGLNKTTNSKVALVLIVLGIFSGVFVFASVRKSFALNRKRRDDMSAKASEHHKKIRAEIEKYTKDEQLRRVINRISSRVD